MTHVLELPERCESASKPDRKLDAEIDVALRAGPGAQFPSWVYTNFPTWRARDDGRVEVVHSDGKGGVNWTARLYTKSIDVALTLLPVSACNIDLFSFGGGGRDDLPKGATCWGFKFHDTAQLVGIERAKAEVSRLKKDSGGLFKVAGAPRLVLERAIAEQFMEFSASHTANAALAVCAAAIRCRTPPMTSQDSVSK